MRYLRLNEVLYLYRRIIESTGGSLGVHSLAALQSSLAQPRQTFGDQELYPRLVEKAGALGYFLVMNHPFVDGNKRIGHAAVELFLQLNGYEIQASVEEQEAVILQLARGEMRREALTAWLERRMVERTDDTHSNS